MSLVLPTLQRLVPRTHDARIRLAPTFPELVVWLKGGDEFDTQGTLSVGGIIGSVQFNGAKLPADSEQSSVVFGGGHIGYLDNATVDAITNGTLCVILFANTGSLSVWRGIWEKRRSGPGSPTGGFGISWNSDNTRLQFDIFDGTTLFRAPAASAITENTPYFLAIRWGAAGMRIRVNKTSVGFNSYTGSIPVGNVENWLWGATGFGGTVSDRWSGRMAHVLIYSRDLTDAELDYLSPYG